MPEVECDNIDCIHNCMGIGDIPICDKNKICIENGICTDYEDDFDLEK